MNNKRSESFKNLHDVMKEEDKVSSEDYRRLSQSPEVYGIYETVPNYESRRDPYIGDTSNEKYVIKYLEAKIDLYVKLIQLGKRTREFKH